MLQLLKDIVLQIPQVIFRIENQKGTFPHLFLLSSVSSPS